MRVKSPCARARASPIYIHLSVPFKVSSGLVILHLAYAEGMRRPSIEERTSERERAERDGKISNLISPFPPFSFPSWIIFVSGRKRAIGRNFPNVRHRWLRCARKLSVHPKSKRGGNLFERKSEIPTAHAGGDRRNWYAKWDKSRLCPPQLQRWKREFDHHLRMELAYRERPWESYIRPNRASNASSAKRN